MLKSIFMTLPKNQGLRSFVIYMSAVLPYFAMYYMGIISQLPTQWMNILCLIASITLGFFTDENGWKNPFVKHDENK
ncbi:hypothetical protein [Shewanella nanhaiensis]|uniref:Holin n=1 Tax=Shewanella nanhaiensis TaxID=2864872 RepID=A0ABS7E0W8_9GAMM|nr:hypothetical protein [Shewanella nanhaiensis]MBW8183335.1 hypothetical protein [Shewanella nanhaiensis]